jgi:hypothetical protein
MVAARSSGTVTVHAANIAYGTFVKTPTGFGSREDEH